MLILQLLCLNLYDGGPKMSCDKIYILKNWTLSASEDTLYAWGNVYDNPQFARGLYIHTHYFESFDIDMQNKRFDAFTRSGSHYALPFDCISTNENDNVKQTLITNGFKSFDADLIEEQYDNWIKLSNKRKQQDEIEKEKEIKSFISKTPERSLYMEVFKDHTTLAIFHRDHMEETEAPLCFEVSTHVHVGMVRDSVLITDWKYGLVDYRYFPYDTRMETYHWSDGLDRLIVKNVSNEAVELDRTLIKPNETVTIERNNNIREGLISPDVVNGKSLLTSLQKKESD